METQGNDLLPWIPYYLIGLTGIYLHILFDAGKVNPWLYIKAKGAEFVTAVISYHLILVLWYLEGVSLFGMIKGQPTALTLGLGYVASSALKNLLAMLAKKFQNGNGTGPGDGSIYTGPIDTIPKPPPREP